MKPAPFSYHAPTTVDEALAHLAAHGYDASVLAGGQSFVPAMNFRLAQPAVLVDLNRIPDLAYIRPGDDGGPTSYGDVHTRARAMIGQMGTPPAVIARSVVEAITQERLFILPNEEIKPLVDERYKRILAGENPPRGDIFGLGDA